MLVYEPQYSGTERDWTWDSYLVEGQLNLSELQAILCVYNDAPGEVRVVISIDGNYWDVPNVLPMLEDKYTPVRVIARRGPHQPGQPGATGDCLELQVVAIRDYVDVAASV